MATCYIFGLTSRLMKPEILSLTFCVTLGMTLPVQAQSPSDRLPARLMYQITDHPVERSEGAIAGQDVIAIHKLRTVEAMVLDQGFSGQFRDVPAGTAMGRILLVDAENSYRRIYCDTRQQGRWNSSSTDCVEDTNQDGIVDYYWTAHSMQYFMFGVDSVTPARNQPEPVQLHQAETHEMPLSQVAFAPCRARIGQNLTLVIALPIYGDNWYNGSGASRCDQGPRLTPGETIEINGMQMEVSGQPGDLHFNVIQPMTVGPALFGLQSIR